MSRGPAPHALVRLLLAAALCGCGAGGRIETASPVAGPGEPILVRLELPGRSSTSLEVLDGSGASLGRTDVTLTDGRAEAWLFPADPVMMEPLRVVAGPPDRAWWRRGPRTTVKLDLARPLVRPRPLDGWYPGESTAAGRYSWTTGCALAGAENPGTGSVLHMRYRCGDEIERTARLRLGGFEAELACGMKEPVWLHQPVPPSAWGGALWAPLSIEVDPPWRPAEALGVEDPRELGLQLYWIVLAPDPTEPSGEDNR